MLLVALTACALDRVELVGKQCPCADGFVCDAPTNRCVGASAVTPPVACSAPCSPQIGALCVDGQCTPPRACSDLGASVPSLASGVYRLAPATGPAFDAYCELDPAMDGGGWTLVLKVAGRSDRFGYDSDLWTNAETVSGDRAALDLVEAKLAGFASIPAREARLGLVDEGQTRWLTFALPAITLREHFAGGYVATSLGRDRWRSLVARPSTQPECRREGWNVVADGRPVGVRLGILFNNEDDCASPDSFIGVGSTFATVAGNYYKDERDTRTFAYVMIR